MRALQLFNNRTFYPAFFRVLIGSVLLVDLLILLPSVNEIYQIPNYFYEIDKSIPFVKYIRANIQLFYFTFIGILLLFILGLGRNLISLVIFIFFTIKYLLLSGISSYGTDILRISLLFFVFVNSFNYFSLNKPKSNGLFSKLATLSIMLHICYIYLSNAILKTINFVWMEGDAFIYFFLTSKTTDVFTITDQLLNYPFFVVYGSYLVIIFQFLFPIFIWFQRTKYVFIIIGIIMHVSMAFILQLYFFEIVVILHYGFFIKDEEWQKLLPFIKIKKVNG